MKKQTEQKRLEYCLEVTVGQRLDQIDRLVIAAMLRWCGENKSRAARMLGISRSTLYKKLEKYNLI